MPWRLQHIAAATLGLLAVSACGGQGSATLDGAYDGECVIEMEFERNAPQSDVDAFIRRVERVPHVERIDVLSRAGNVARFREAIRDEGYTGQTYDQLMARARYAGRVLLVKADDDRNVFAIIDMLQALPAAIGSVAERDSCPGRS
jgi:hypothetical protein